MVMGRKTLLSLLLLVNIVLLLVCQHFLGLEKSPDYQLKMQAAAKAYEAQQVIGERLLGEEYTPITTTLGAKDAKLLSAHPDFAALTVEMLEKANVKKGDVVAVNMSGSFPALNIAVIAAINAMGAEPVTISSVGASTWGANRPDYTWQDMEAALNKAGVWSWKSTAVSIGGVGDMGGGLQHEGIDLIRQAAERTGNELLESKSLNDAIQKRLDIYKDANKGQLPKVLVNVGGNHVIFGTNGHAAFLHQGFTEGYRPSLAGNDGLAAKFIEAGRPVIHFINIQRLGAEYDIHLGSTTGQSKVYYTQAVPKVVRGVIIIWIIVVIGMLYNARRKGMFKQ
jgi:poly-gamma-glutamate system protein